MSKDKREVSLDQIRNNKRIGVILISFKAGSTGERPIFQFVSRHQREVDHANNDQVST
jgi:hypothetical protein